MCRHGPVSPVAGAGDHIVTSYWVRKQAEQAEPAFAPGRSQLTPSVILVLDTGTRAPWRPDRRHCTHSPRPRHQPLPPMPPIPLSCLSRPVEARPEPVEGRPETLWRRRPVSVGPFTSKCRKMSQNVALFHPSTRKPLQFTSGESHVLGRFPAILAHFRSFSCSAAVIPVRSYWESTGRAGGERGRRRRSVVLDSRSGRPE